MGDSLGWSHFSFANRQIPLYNTKGNILKLKYSINMYHMIHVVNDCGHYQSMTIHIYSKYRNTLALIHVKI